MLFLGTSGQGSPFGGLDIRDGRGGSLALRHHACRRRGWGVAGLGGSTRDATLALPILARSGEQEEERLGTGGALGGVCLKQGHPPPCPAPRTPTLHVILEELLRAKLEDVIQLLLGHGTGLGAQARSHHQVGEHHLALGHLRDALLHRGPRHEAVDHHLLVLPNAVGAAEGLGATCSLAPWFNRGLGAQGQPPGGGVGGKGGGTQMRS